MILVPPLGAGSCGRDFVCMIMVSSVGLPWIVAGCVAVGKDYTFRNVLVGVIRN